MDQLDQPRGHPDAIVRPTAAARVIDLDRRAPGEELRQFVDYHWYVGWRVPGTYRQQVVPQPRIHVAAEDGRLLVHGISRGPFVRSLSGRGHTLGCSFRPGGFRCLLGSSVGALAGRVVPAGELLGVDDVACAERILATEDVGVMVDALESYLLSVGPAPDPVAREVEGIVAWARDQHGLHRAEDLAAHAGRSLRSLQRLFTEYVGIGPKWVITRYRLLDAAAAAHGGDPVDWAALAAELGFTDQAHLTRAFTRVVGTPPAGYRREL